MYEGILAIDFDGTLCAHEFPAIGAEVPGAFGVLKELQAAGHRLILWTMRDDDRVALDDAHERVLAKAVDWCKERGIEFWAENRNPEQDTWSLSPKVYAHQYVDDAALGCPLMAMPNAKAGDRLVVDWKKVRLLLARRGWLKSLPKGPRPGSKHQAKFGTC